MQRAKVLIIGAGLLLAAAGSAFAEGEEPPATGDGSGSGSAAVSDPGPSTGGIYTKDTWPEEELSRPLTLAKGMLELGADFEVAHFSVTSGMTTVSATGESLHLGVGYGVSDKLTVGGGYSFALHDFEIKGLLDLFGAFSLMHSAKLDVSASADLLINLVGATDMMGNTSATETISAGLGVRYKVAPKIAVFTGGGTVPIGPALTAGSPFGPLAGSVQGQHLSIGLNSNAPISFDIPVGVGLQATPKLYAAVSTNLAHIKISNGANAFIFADYIPLNVGAYYAASKKLDVGAYLDVLDLKNGFDFVLFGITGRYRM